ncbi:MULTISPECIES: hypothetical protein [unclassified Haladaptatus]|uniref:hypothetical protein n=1 Tax=unclassified Haladaptatus TaxID=2622732 RepID=UPI00209C1547|nr:MULTISPECIES: hypothetical protein [unclassified Haladaptatus]MCO8246994.1 hypothetical protein [Haladaptatus sp. AB643]MCO8254623.1 hypothetical protein [Haladaptatus sp. AB618]
MTEPKTETSAKPRTTEWATDEGNDSPLVRTLSTVGKGILTGIIGGMAAFTYTQSSLITWTINPQYILLLVASTGAFAHLLAYDLHESIRIGIVAFLSGTITLTLSWVAPLLLLPYSGTARDLLLPRLLGNALRDVLLVYAGVFLGAYLLTLTVDAYVTA